MIRIGAVNIDTSHPKMFSKYLLQNNRARYTAVFNDGFRGMDEVNGFAKEANLDKICDSIEELADYTDIGFIHSCNWDKHLEYAMPFFSRGKPVFIDKPIVGNLKDCDTLRELEKKGKVILGSSSVRYCEEIQSFMALPEEKRGKIVFASGCAGTDEFNYAIHAVEGISALMGRGIRSVRYLGAGRADDQACESYYITYKNGSAAVYHSLIPQFINFQFMVVTTKKSVSIMPDLNKLYGALLDRICDYMVTGKNTLAGVDELCDSIELMLASKLSKQNGGTEEFISDLKNKQISFDGDAFEKIYAAEARKLYIK